MPPSQENGHPGPIQKLPDWTGPADKWVKIVGGFVTICGALWAAYQYWNDETTIPLAGIKFKHIDRPQPAGTVPGRGRKIVQFDVANPGPGTVHNVELEVIVPERHKGGRFDSGLLWYEINGCVCTPSDHGDDTKLLIKPTVGNGPCELAPGKSFGLKIATDNVAWEPTKALGRFSGSKEDIPATKDMPDYPGLRPRGFFDSPLGVTLMTLGVGTLVTFLVMRRISVDAVQKREAVIRENERLLAQDDLNLTRPEEGSQNEDILVQQAKAATQQSAAAPKVRSNNGG